MLSFEKSKMKTVLINCCFSQPKATLGHNLLDLPIENSSDDISITKLFSLTDLRQFEIKTFLGK